MGEIINGIEQFYKMRWQKKAVEDEEKVRKIIL